MMNAERFLKYVTVTGADDSVNHDEILQISKKFPFVEFGILLRASEPSLRYPSYEWIKKLFDLWQDNPEINVSGHICGSLVRDICKGNWSIFQDPRFSEVSPMFSRFQLNFSPYVNGINIPDFLQGMDREELYFKQIIFQLKDINEPILIEAKKEDFDVVPIFDISGGRGISPENWPYSNELCGYAGGLNPNNVSQEIVKISKVSNEAWIDAESGLRTNNEFDLSKVEYFLNQSLSWWNFSINVNSVDAK